MGTILFSENKFLVIRYVFPSAGSHTHNLYRYICEEGEFTVMQSYISVNLEH